MPEFPYRALVSGCLLFCALGCETTVSPDQLPVIEHTPVDAAVENSPVGLSVRVTDPGGSLTSVLVHYRVGEGSWSELPQADGADGPGFTFELAAELITPAGVDYWIEATGALGSSSDASAEAPHSIEVSDLAPPAPLGLDARYEHGDGTVGIAWELEDHWDVAGARLERGSSADDSAPELLQEGDQGSFVDDWADGGTSYGWYRLTTLDPQGTPSEASVVQRQRNLHLRELTLGALNEGIPFFGTGAGEFNAPGGVAVDGDRVFVVDTNNNRIEVFDAEGSRTASWGAGGGEQGSAPGEFFGPQDIAFLSDGSVLVVDTGNFRLQLLDAGGNPQGQVGDGGELTLPFGVAVDGEDTIYVADFGRSRIAVFDASLNELDAIESVAGTALTRPRRVRYSALHQSLLILDDSEELLVYPLGTGSEQRIPLGEDISEEFSNTDVCVSPWGELAVTQAATRTVLGAEHRVEKLFFDLGSDWTFGSFSVEEGDLARPAGCAFGPDGSLWTVEILNHRLQRFGP